MLILWLHRLHRLRAAEPVHARTPERRRTRERRRTTTRTRTREVIRRRRRRPEADRPRGRRARGGRRELRRDRARGGRARRRAHAPHAGGEPGAHCWLGRGVHRRGRRGVRLCLRRRVRRRVLWLRLREPAHAHAHTHAEGRWCRRGCWRGGGRAEETRELVNARRTCNLLLLCPRRLCAVIKVDEGQIAARPRELGGYGVRGGGEVALLERLVAVDDGIDLVVYLQERVCADGLCLALVGDGWKEGGRGVPSDSGSSVSALDIHPWIFGRALVRMLATC